MITHGTQYGYKIARCRCVFCKDWNATNARMYRKKRIAKGWKLRTGKWVTPPDSESQS